MQAMLPGQLHYYETARMLVLQGCGKRKQPRLAGAPGLDWEGSGFKVVVFGHPGSTAHLLGRSPNVTC